MSNNKWSAIQAWHRRQAEIRAPKFLADSICFPTVVDVRHNTMAVQTDSTPETPSSKHEAVAFSKKRKHDADEKQSSKKKAKQQDGLETSLPTATPASVGVQKKNRRRKSKMGEGEDVELNGAPSIDVPRSPAVDNVPSTSPALDVDETPDTAISQLLESSAPSPFYSCRISLYVPIPAISLSTATSSLLSAHLAPLLLTYFPPARGIVLAFSDPVLSATADSGVNLPLLPPGDGGITIREEEDTLARAADEFGVCWVWLTATLLVFRPERGDKLYGWSNVTSEGFVGLVSYNYFQTAVGKSRIPAEWRWNGPTKEQRARGKRKAKKGKLHDENRPPSQSQDDAVPGAPDDEPAGDSPVPLDDDIGFFTDAAGSRIKPTLKFRVVDTEIVPAHDKDRWSLQIDGTLLDDKAEQNVLEEERAKFERTRQHRRSRTPGVGGDDDTLMSGGLALSREGSVLSRLSGDTPRRHRVAY